MDDEFHFAMNNPMAKTNPNYKANNQPLHPKQPDYTNVVTKAWNMKTKEMKEKQEPEKHKHKRSASDGDQLKNKQGDFWGMAQALIADPQLVTKTLAKKEDDIYKCLAHLKIGSCHRCRYLKQKDLDFACVTPGSWSPDLINKINLTKRKKDISHWKKIISSLN